MVFKDFTPMYLVPTPWKRLLAAARGVVTNEWDIERSVLDNRADARDNLVLLASYYDKRREFLNKSPQSRSDIDKYYLGYMLVVAGVASVVPWYVGTFFEQGFWRRSVILGVSLINGLGVLFQAISNTTLNIGRELAEIEDFDRTHPSIVSMARYEERKSSADQAIDDIAHSAPGTPILPPGMTELILSRDNKSLRAIRSQLQMTHRTDFGMTFVSFTAFIVAVAICFWLLNETGRISQGLISVGGSGLVGLFCLYSTARARSSQLALLLFEALAAELTIALLGASTLNGEECRNLEHAAWRSFRIELNDLYLLEQDRKAASTGSRGKGDQTNQ